MYLLIKLPVDQAELDKVNRKRKAAGNQETTALAEAENHIGGLQNNWIFRTGEPIVVSEVPDRDIVDLVYFSAGRVDKVESAMQAVRRLFA